MDGEDSKKEQNIGGTVGRKKGLITLLRIRVVMLGCQGLKDSGGLEG